MFGFTCYKSLWQSKTNGGNIPYPCDNENTIGGHAVIVVGYDDEKRNHRSLTYQKLLGY
jgi:C1A family cysteine protease